MAVLSEQFRQASSNIEPSDDDKDNAQACHAEVRTVLEQSDKLGKFKIDTVLIGSYKRHVSIRRMKDVDVLSKLDLSETNLRPGALLDVFETTLKTEYGSDRITRQAHSLRVDFPARDLSVDAIPARGRGDHWEIVDGADGWLETNPEDLTNKTSAMNEQHTLGSDGVYVPIVKLMRQLRRANDIRKPSGLYFEILTYWAFKNGLEASSRAEYFAKALQGTAAVLANAISAGGLDDPTLPGAFISTSATSTQLDHAQTLLSELAQKAERALDADDCEAAVIWRKILGKLQDGTWAFPIPAHCSEDGTRLAAVYIPGETRVPQGNDRFASYALER